MITSQIRTSCNQAFPRHQFGHKTVLLYETLFRSNFTTITTSNRNEYQEHFLGVKAAGA